MTLGSLHGSPSRKSISTCRQTSSRVVVMRQLSANKVPCPADRGKVRRLWVTAPAWHVLRFQQAGPILKKHGLALTYLVFVLSQYLGRVLTRAPGVRSRRLNQRLSCQSPLDDPPLDRPLITSSFVNSSPNNSNSSSLSLSPPQL